MKSLIIVFLISMFIMGIFDGGDVTGTLVLSCLILPGVFSKKQAKKVGDK